jgi:hypothetical protein
VRDIRHIGAGALAVAVEAEVVRVHAALEIGVARTK